VKGPALETFWQWLAAIAPGAGMAWDIETERLDPASPTRCVGFEVPVCPPDQPGRVWVDPKPLSECNEFHQWAIPGRLLIAHNGKYEAQALLARGIDPGQFVWWDTMLAEWVLVANNTQGLGLNLDDTAQRYGCTPKDPWVDEMIKAGRVMDIPLDRLMERNRKDVVDCRTVYEGQLARMTPAQVRLTVVRCMYMVELARIEREGKCLDSPRVTVATNANALAVAEHESALRDILRGANPRSVNEMAPVLYGMWPADATDLDKFHWLPSCQCLAPLRKHRPKGESLSVLRCSQCKAPTGKGEPVVESLGFKEPVDRKGKPLRTAKTKGWPNGRPQLTTEAMTAVAKTARTPRQKTWAKHHLALTELYAERDKNLRYFSAVCEVGGGVVYADLMQGVAATHRLTCRGRRLPGIEHSCQLQNVPAHLKRLFKPKRPGYLAAEVDQSQAEFRGAGFLSQCPQCLADIADPGFDAHIQSAQVLRDGRRDLEKYRALFGEYKANPKAVKPLRNGAKGHTFKPLFGGSSGTDRERAYYQWFGEHYHGITAAQEKWDTEVANTGRYVSPTGMVFSWPIGWTEGWRGDMRMVNADNGRSLYSIVRNLPIQYFATGELAMVSFLCLVYLCRSLGLRFHPVMLVHDSVEGELHPEDEGAWHDACGVAYGPHTWEFLHGVYGIRYNVELASESSTGSHFGEGSDVPHHYTHKETPDMKFAEGGEKRPRELVPAGTHVAIVNQVVDMGVQPGVGDFKPSRKVLIRFEVPEERVKYKRGEQELEGPMVIARKDTASMNEKANLRKFLEGMLGKKFKSGEAAQFDVTSILGKACLITVAHTEPNAKGQVYANVVSASPLMKGQKAPKAERPLLVYDLENPDQAVFEQLAPWLQKAINKPAEPGDVPVNEGEGAPDLGAE
jgi:hypothetical protein